MDQETFQPGEARSMKNLRDMLIRHEGMRLHPYLCQAGKVTIGIGRNLDDNGITEEEATYLLGNDITRSVQEAYQAFPWLMYLDQTRCDVIISMCFNMGLTRMRTFKKFLAAAEVKDYDLAAAEMLNSAWAEQVPARAHELAEMFHTGLYK